MSTATRSADSAYRDDEAYALLDRVKHCCLFDDDDGGIGVTEDPHIPAELFDAICTFLNAAPKRTV